MSAEKKIYPNDPCPCGSGKKYKHCCKLLEKSKKSEKVLAALEKNFDSSGGPVISIDLRGNDVVLPSKDSILFEYSLSDLSEVEFVKQRLNEDIFYIYFLMQFILGDFKHAADYRELEKKIPEGKLLETLEVDIADDGFNVHKAYEEMKEKFIGSNAEENICHSKRALRPYESYGLDKSRDLLSFYRENKISIYQVLAFHMYLMRRLESRFDDYRYIPSSGRINGNIDGLNQHRGFDILIGIIINIEIQLGIHIILEEQYVKDNVKCPSGQELHFSELEDGIIRPDTFDKLRFATKILIKSFEDVLDRIERHFDPASEILALYKQEALSEEGCKERLPVLMREKNQISHYPYNYISALKCMCIGELCGGFIKRDFSYHALKVCSQIDYVKIIQGVLVVHDLFQTDEMGDRLIKGYHEAVFYLTDEKNGMAHGIYPEELDYIDDPNVKDDSLEVTHNLFYLKNPAIRETFYFGHNLFRLDMFEFLQGCYMPFVADGKLYGAYPIIPFLAKHSDPILHCKSRNDFAFDVAQMLYDNEYYVEDFEKRQSRLDLELNLEEFPATCLREYLNPSVFYNWKEKKEYYKTIQDQNIELKKQMDINHVLVRNVAHSAVNYLNSERLTKTGVTLHNAKEDDPTLEELHSDGLLLMLQSEQERYLTRLLKAAVRKHQIDVSEKERNTKIENLGNRIRGSISKKEGISLEGVLDYALKTVIARVLFGDNDDKGIYIRKKLNKTDFEWTNSMSMFMTDVLAINDDRVAFDWWNKNWTAIELSISDMWKKFRIKKNGDFYDLILEIIVEIMINFLAHGKLQGGVKLEFGQENDQRNRPLWAYIRSENEIGETCTIKSGVGLSSLNNDILLLNGSKRGIGSCETETMYETKVWLDRKLLSAK